MKNLGVNLISLRFIVIPFSARPSYEAAIQGFLKQNLELIATFSENTCERGIFLVEF